MNTPPHNPKLTPASGQLLHQCHRLERIRMLCRPRHHQDWHQAAHSFAPGADGLLS
jgi:hypothetical protein